MVLKVTITSQQKWKGQITWLATTRAEAPNKNEFKISELNKAYVLLISMQLLDILISTCLKFVVHIFFIHLHSLYLTSRNIYLQ